MTKEQRQKIRVEYKFFEEIQIETEKAAKLEAIDQIEKIASQCFPYDGLSDEHGFHLAKFHRQLTELKKELQ